MRIAIPQKVWIMILGAVITIGAARVEVWFRQADARREKRDAWEHAVNDTIRKHHWQIIHLQKTKLDK